MSHHQRWSRMARSEALAGVVSGMTTAILVSEKLAPFGGDNSTAEVSDVLEVVPELLMSCEVFLDALLEQNIDPSVLMSEFDLGPRQVGFVLGYRSQDRTFIPVVVRHRSGESRTFPGHFLAFCGSPQAAGYTTAAISSLTYRKQLKLLADFVGKDSHVYTDPTAYFLPHARTPVEDVFNWTLYEILGTFPVNVPEWPDRGFFNIVMTEWRRQQK